MCISHFYNPIIKALNVHKGRSCPLCPHEGIEMLDVDANMVFFLAQSLCV